MAQSEGIRSRRALLQGAFGVLGGVVAVAIGKAAPVSAGTDQYIVLGGNGAQNYSSTPTRVENGMNDGSATFRALQSAATGDGMGLRGETASKGVNGDQPAAGVWGLATHDEVGTVAVGVLGTTQSRGSATSGVLGVCDPVGTTIATGNGVKGISGPGNGVLGTATTGIGVKGVATSGTGVSGHGSATGYGVYATAPGIALYANGRVKFKPSGVATIPANATSVVVTPGLSVLASSFVLLTPKANIGSRALWFSTDTTNNRFTIKISSPYSTSAGLQIAWLLVG